MEKLSKTSSIPSITPSTKPDKVETFGGKYTARVTKSYNQPDGSTIKVTRKINKDNSISDKIERRYK